MKDIPFTKLLRSNYNLNLFPFLSIIIFINYVASQAVVFVLGAGQRLFLLSVELGKRRHVTEVLDPRLLM